MEWDNPEQVHDLIGYHNLDNEMLKKMTEIQSATEFMINTIASCTPKSADQSAAIRHVREAMMTANASIVLNGRV